MNGNWYTKNLLLSHINFGNRLLIFFFFACKTRQNDDGDFNFKFFSFIVIYSILRNKQINFLGFSKKKYLLFLGDLLILCVSVCGFRNFIGNSIRYFLFALLFTNKFHKSAAIEISLCRNFNEIFIRLSSFKLNFN